MMGNPWSYRGHTLEWSRIRLLTKWDDIEMEYNASGMRTRKGDTYYELDGNNIISETTNGNTIRYYYGNGGIVGFRYNGNRYYYEKNLQGDIIGIYDEDANKLCEYVYDAWGNCTIKNDVSDARIGEVNSFRYRGYYYDSELGLYYLKSRYYDAAIGKFINADEISYLGANCGVLGYNLYSYCCDNPILYCDKAGTNVEINPYYRLKHVGEIHNAVVKHIASTSSYGFNKEHVINGGCIDLITKVDTISYLYEVKPYTYESGSNFNRVLKQVNRYVSEGEQRYLASNGLTRGRFVHHGGKDGKSDFLVIYESNESNPWLVTYTFVYIEDDGNDEVTDCSSVESTSTNKATSSNYSMPEFSMADSGNPVMLALAIFLAYILLIPAGATG